MIVRAYAYLPVSGCIGTWLFVIGHNFSLAGISRLGGYRSAGGVFLPDTAKARAYLAAHGGVIAEFVVGEFGQLVDGWASVSRTLTQNYRDNGGKPSDPQPASLLEAEFGGLGTHKAAINRTEERWLGLRLGRGIVLHVAGIEGRFSSMQREIYRSGPLFSEIIACQGTCEDLAKRLSKPIDQILTPGAEVEFLLRLEFFGGSDVRVRLVDILSA